MPPNGRPMLLDRVRLGLSVRGWVAPELGWGAGTPLERVLSQIAQAGYAGTELSALLPSDAAGIRRVLEPHGLVLAGAHRPFSNLDEGKRLIDLVAAAGGTYVAFSEAPPDEALDALGKHGKGAEVAVTFRPRFGSALSTREAIEQLLESTHRKRVGLCFDTGHLACAGLNLLDAVTNWSGRVGHVYLTDVRPDALASLASGTPLEDAVRRGLFCAPGQGEVDFPAILNTLDNAKFEGWLMVEALQDPARHDPLEAAREAMAYLARVFGDTVWA